MLASLHAMVFDVFSLFGQCGCSIDDFLHPLPNIVITVITIPRIVLISFGPVHRLMHRVSLIPNYCRRYALKICLLDDLTLFRLLLAQFCWRKCTVQTDIAIERC